MSKSLGMSADQVSAQNLKFSVLAMIGIFVFMFLFKKYHPLQIINRCIMIFCVFLPFLPLCIENIGTSSVVLSFIQFMTYFLAFSVFAVEMACFQHLPITKRFTVLATTFGCASAVGYTVVSFSLIPLTNYLGSYALWVIYILLVVALNWAVNYVKKLEIKKGRYYSYPNERSMLDSRSMEEVGNNESAEEKELRSV
ncbi:MFS transporter [Candidatus Bandiella euplotis]|uniref:MFS transporter domain protein n=1 Tax=Candidatus Bandiella euplotis TaxID=1664265 RepID=A0ABZ0USE1_9RICK|nr:hypothetical protein [Candidatus Bandiella woodruffii]WPX96980.1 MFS transporter domain protein [Candidatus Bandiella woodruffii]